MIIPLQHGKAVSARPRRPWSLRTDAAPRSRSPIGGLSRRGVQALVSPALFRLLFGSVVVLLIFNLVGRQIAGVAFVGLSVIYLAWGKLPPRQRDQLQARRARSHSRSARQDQCL